MSEISKFKEQRMEILEYLYSEYYNHISIYDYKMLTDIPHEYDNNIFYGHIVYLDDNGYIKAKPLNEGEMIHFCRITGKGIDLVEKRLLDLIDKHLLLSDPSDF